MHLDKDSIGRTIENIAMILKFGGRFFFSISIQRYDVNDHREDEKGRYFTSMSEVEWVKCCEKYGLKFEHSEITDDGVGRDGIVWLTCIMKKIVN